VVYNVCAKMTIFHNQGVIDVGSVGKLDFEAKGAGLKPPRSKGEAL